MRHLRKVANEVPHHFSHEWPIVGKKGPAFVITKQANNSVGDHPHAREVEAHMTEEAEVASEEAATSVQEYTFLFFHLLSLLLDACLLLSMKFIISCPSSANTWFCFVNV